MIVGQRIEEQLRALGISQAELARRVRLDQSTINGLVRGTSKSSRHIHKIAQVLRTTPAFLLGETDDPDGNTQAPDLTADERELVDLIRSIAPKDKAAILQLTRSIAHCTPSPTIHEPGREFRRTGTDG